MPYTRSPQNWRKNRWVSYKPRLKKKIQGETTKSKHITKNIVKGLVGVVKIGKKPWFKTALQILLIAGVILFLLGGIVLVAMLAYYSKDLPDPNKLIDRNVAQSTKIFDRTGEHLLYEIHGEKNRTIIKIEDLQKYTRDALIALEDKNFYKHGGFSYKRIFLAVLTRLYTSTGPGASTLTQQLVKNAILTPEKTISRKLKEWILTFQIERKFTKDQILQMYFNEIPYGSTAYGIESAAKLYFQKNAKDLTLAESAALAAMVKAPTYYSPYGNNKDKLLARKDLTLELMAEQGYITPEEMEKAKKEEIKFQSKIEKIEAPHFVMYVKQMLTNLYGEKLVEQGGLKVTTTLDYDLQKIAEEAVTNGISKIEKNGGGNAGLLALNPKNGEILAMVGSRDYFDETHDGNVNVTLSLRQPGSSFKPIVYAAAFKKGYTPETILYDVVTNFKTPTKPYTPHNYDNAEHGPVSMKKALAGSLNIPAVKIIYLTGIENVLTFAEDLGYSSFKDRSRFGLSLVLGGGEVKLIEHLAAFGAFANDGEEHKTRAILKVEDKNSKVLEEFKDEAKQVMDKNIARQINSILSDNNARAYIFGINNSLTLGSRPVAAKTGTTNDYRDAWTLGYTPSLAAGVWAGNNDNTEMKRGADGSIIAAPIWNEFMKKALADSEAEQFAAPAQNKSTKPVLLGRDTTETRVKVCTLTNKLATEYTPLTYTEERIYKEVHNILHYVNKDNPQGPGPTNPAAADPQYSAWEEAVQRWFEENKEKFLKEKQEEAEKEATETTGTEPLGNVPIKVVVNEAPPTEYCDDHRLEFQPSLTILAPQNNQTIAQNYLSVDIDVTAPKGVGRIEYYIDDKLSETIKSFPFDLYNLSIIEIPNGFHTLKIIAYDVIDNWKESKIEFNLKAPKPSLTMAWVEPRKDVIYTSADFPVSISVRLSRSSDVQKINLYFTDEKGEDKIIGSDSSFEDNIAKIIWQTPPQPGTYKIHAEALTSDQTIPNESITVTVTD